MNDSSPVAALIEANGFGDADDAEVVEQEKPQNQEAKGLSPFQLLIGVILRPRKTFTALRDMKKNHWWMPVLVAMVGLLLLAIAENVVMQSILPSLPEEVQMMMSGGGGILTILGGMISGGISVLLRIFLFSGIVFGGSLILGGKSTWKQSMGIVAWASIPLAIRSIIQAIASFITVGYAVSGLQGAMSMMEAVDHGVLYALLGQFDIYYVWSLVLVGIGAAVTVKLKKFKPLILVLIYVLIGVLLVVIMAAVSGWIMGLLSGGGLR